MNAKKKKADRPFSVELFVIIIGVTLAIYCAGMSYLTPRVWLIQTTAPAWKLVTVIVVGKGMNCVAEFLFHRYFLHRPFPLLKRLYRQHTLHHGLTNILLVEVKDGMGKVVNRYPIIKEQQHQASYFPWHSLGSFIVVSWLLYIPAQILLPTWPVLLGSALSITLSIVLYELLHAMEHFSYEDFWKKRIENPRFGRWWNAFYCFHFRHHADIKTNENISGFFGLPVADWLFGTYAPWPHVVIDGQVVSKQYFDSNPPKPVAVIRWLDGLSHRSS